MLRGQFGIVEIIKSAPIKAIFLIKNSICPIFISGAADEVIGVATIEKSLVLNLF